jgi:hypothetical protein
MRFLVCALARVPPCVQVSSWMVLGATSKEPRTHDTSCRAHSGAGSAVSLFRPPDA